MKKFVFSALAAGALAFGGAASAQDLGSIVANVLALGNGPAYSNGNVVTRQCSSSYIDMYNRPVCVDGAGRHIVMQSNDTGGPVDRRWGNYAYRSNGWDSDGDGITNARDRWPDNRSYW